MRRKKFFGLMLIVVTLDDITTNGTSTEILTESHPHKAEDYVGKRDKIKMIRLVTELKKESFLKVRQIKDIREEHEKFVAFNVGVIIGKIREKYRFMEEIYKDIINKHKTRNSNIFGPGMIKIRTLHYIIALEMLHWLSIEIDKFVHVLESSAEPHLKANRIHIPKTGKLRTRLNEEEKIDKFVNEQIEKSNIRQAYLIKRLGLAPNITTTRKRFMNQWPVEETWSLEEYSKI